MLELGFNILIGKFCSLSLFLFPLLSITKSSCDFVSTKEMATLLYHISLLPDFHVLNFVVLVDIQITP